MDGEHRKKISETIKLRHAQGKHPKIPRCLICKCFIGKEHDCNKIKEKQRQAKLENPTNYWLGKKRPDIGQKVAKKLKGRTYPHLRGENNPIWIGSYGWYHKEARNVMSQKVERQLKSTEIVHHIDGDWKNNKIENLIITNRSSHAKIHYEQGELRIDGAPKK